MGSRTRVARKTRDRKFTRVLTTFVVLGGLIISGYYVYSTTLTDGGYKIYVGGKKYENGKVEIDQSSGLSGNHYKDGKPFHELNNPENKQPIGGSSGGAMFQESLVDDRTGIKYSSGFKYLMSLASDDERSVQPATSDNGQSGEANGDEFLATKFYISNNLQPDPLTGSDGSIEYAIRIDVTENSKNALSALRFGFIKVSDESNIYDIDSGTVDNSCFQMIVVGQPKMEEQENGDILMYTGDEPDSAEYVSSIVQGQYTNDENAQLFKNPNKGHENEDWKCSNLHLDPKSNQWYYDSYEHEDISFKISPGEQDPFVISIWYEASDPNHNNDILGGYVSFIITYYDVNA